MVSEIQPGQTISRRPPTRLPGRPPTHPDTMGENNTPTALKGCGVKMCKCSREICVTHLMDARTDGRMDTSTQTQRIHFIISILG